METNSYLRKPPTAFIPPPYTSPRMAESTDCWSQEEKDQQPQTCRADVPRQASPGDSVTLGLQVVRVARDEGTSLKNHNRSFQIIKHLFRVVTWSKQRVNLDPRHLYRLQQLCDKSTCPHRVPVSDRAEVRRERAPLDRGIYYSPCAIKGQGGRPIN